MTSAFRNTVTLRDIANAVGVSAMTASRCLSGSGRVDPTTRQRIQAAARRLGYRSERSAVSPAGRARRLADIGLRLLLPVFPHNRAGIDSPLAQELLGGLQTRLEEINGRLDIEEIHSLGEIEELSRQRRSHAVVLRTPLPRTWVQRLTKTIPIISATAHDSQTGVDCIYTNEHRSAACIQEHLQAKGHQRIVWFGITDRFSPEQRAVNTADDASALDQYSSLISHGVRHAAWANVVHNQDDCGGQSILILKRDWRTQTLDDVINKAIDHILALRPQPTAIVVAADAIAQEVIRVLKDRGLNVPHDISLAAYGGVIPAKPALTTIKLPMRLVGRTIPELVERRLADPHALPVSLQLEAELSPGETVYSRIQLD